jgi:nitrous oxidase accessory protein NosD
VRFTSPHLRTAPIARAMLLLAVFVTAGIWQVPRVYAQLSGTKTCTGFDSTTAIGSVVNCTLVIEASATDIPGVPPTLINITAVGGNYLFTGVTSCTAVGGGTCTVITGAGATISLTCSVGPCTTLTITETLTITAATPASLTQQITVLSPLATITVAFIPGTGKTFFVSPTGSDTADCASTATPCLTVNRALQVARDGDTINLFAGLYTIERTIQVAKLVTIQPQNTGDKVVLKANPGVTIFEVTAQGGPNLHVTISGFTMGGNFRRGLTDPAIRLLNDNYTTISNNIIGAEDLPINNAIVISNSDHPTIENNTIQGSTQFVFSSVLTVGQTVTGFGIVSIECFGTSLPGVSDSVIVRNNLFTNLWIAGIWMCSDGAGEHEITSNVFRNNWRGIVLKDVTDTLVNTNILIDDRNDGIILYGASLHNTVQGNTVESHVAADAAAIRIGWVADPLVPLDNLVDDNTLVRVTVGIHVFGARTTVITNNDIKVSGARTAILLTPSTTLGDPGTQPYDTEIGSNVIIFTGPCTPVIGCGLRLLGVVTPVVAINNNWGLRRVRDVEAVIWHQNDDPAVGCVLYTPFTPTVLPDVGTPVPLCGIAAGVVPPSGMPTPVPTPSPTMTNGNGTATATATATAGATSNSPVTSVSLPSGCSTMTWPGADGLSVADMALGITPAAAQQTATIWRKDNGDWRGYGSARDLATDVFTIRRNDSIMVCVNPARHMVDPHAGGRSLSQVRSPCGAPPTSDVGLRTSDLARVLAPRRGG